MTISRLTTYSPSVVASLDALMHELSPTSYCDADKLAMALSDHNSYVFVAEEDGQIVGNDDDTLRYDDDNDNENNNNNNNDNEVSGQRV